MAKTFPDAEPSIGTPETSYAGGGRYGNDANGNPNCR